MDVLAKLNAYELHKLVMQRLQGQTKAHTRTDADVIKENHRFLWDESEPEDWEQRLAKKYYSKLFREYCICDLSMYKENKIAMRWRIEAEVVTGKGQFICGSKKCPEKDELRSWEVNFTYLEHGEKKNALVKLRLCPSCSKKLNYHSTKRLVTKQKRLRKGTGKIEDTSVDPSANSSKSLEDPGQEETKADTDQETPEDRIAESRGQSQWTEKAPVEEKSREEEFSEYLEDLLL